MMQDGAPRDSFSREVPLNVTLYGCVVGLLSFLIIWLGVLCFVPRDAYAFTIDGEWYPDSLAGYTVTMNSQLLSPAGSTFCDQWWPIYVETESAPSSMPSGNTALSLYAFFETPTHAGSGDPWFWYVSWAQSFDQNASLPSSSAFPFQTYWARYGYDGASGVEAWWGIKGTRPTVTFRSYINDPTPILEEEEFIIWIVHNSDFRTRYGGSSGTPWQNPVIVQNGTTFGWSANENNPSSTLSVQRWTSQLGGSGSWENVYFYNEAPRVGSYTATQSGKYRFVWNYTFQGSSYTYTSNEYSVVIDTSSTLGFQAVTTSSTGNGQLFIFATLTGDPDRVLLQVDNDGTWETYGTLTYGTVNSSQGWWWQGYIQEGKSYRLLASTDMPLNSVPYDLGLQNGSSSYDVVSYAAQVSTWVLALITSIPDMFLWMPIEVRTVLISAIIIMIVLGVVGWLKS